LKLSQFLAAILLGILLNWANLSQLEQQHATPAICFTKPDYFYCLVIRAGQRAESHYS
jgi:hypothetical protein